MDHSRGGPYQANRFSALGPAYEPVNTEIEPPSYSSLFPQPQLPPGVSSIPPFDATVDGGESVERGSGERVDGVEDSRENERPEYGKRLSKLFLLLYAVLCTLIIVIGVLWDEGQLDDMKPAGTWHHIFGAGAFIGIFLLLISVVGYFAVCLRRYHYLSLMIFFVVLFSAIALCSLHIYLSARAAFGSPNSHSPYGLPEHSRYKGELTEAEKLNEQYLLGLDYASFSVGILTCLSQVPLRPQATFKAACSYVSRLCDKMRVKDKISDLESNGIGPRVGIVAKTVRPWGSAECLKQNRLAPSRIAFDPTGHWLCPNSPGFGFDVLLLILEFLAMGPPQLVLASTWESTNKSDGLIDLASKGLIDFTLPDLAILDSRRRKVSFSEHTVSTPGPCFLVCNLKNLLHKPRSGLTQSFTHRKFILFYILCILLPLILLWTVEEWNTQDNRLQAVLKAFQRLILGQNPRVQRNQVLLSVIRALLLLIFVRCVYRSGLLLKFAPYHKFPFRDVEHLSNALRSGEWRMSMRSRKAAAMNQLMHDRALEPLRHNYIEKGHFEPCIISDPAILARSVVAESFVYFDSHVPIGSFMRNEPQLNCLCDTLNTEIIILEGAVATHLNSSRLIEKITGRTMSPLDSSSSSSPSSSVKEPAASVRSLVPDISDLLWLNKIHCLHTVSTARA